MNIENTALKSKYLYLLFSLIAYFLTIAFLVDLNIGGGAQKSLFSFVILFSLYSISHHKIILYIAAILGLITFIENGLSNIAEIGERWVILRHTSNILFLSLIIFSVISNLLSHKKVTIDTLLGAICGYLLIGFLWTFFYMLIATLTPHAFSDPMLSSDGQQKIQHFIYYSFVTLTTIGYGDIVSICSIARTLSWLEGVAGQAYLTIWIAQLVGLHIVHKQRES